MFDMILPHSSSYRGPIPGNYVVASHLQSFVAITTPPFHSISEPGYHPKDYEIALSYLRHIRYMAACSAAAILGDQTPFRCLRTCPSSFISQCFYLSCCSEGVNFAQPGVDDLVLRSVV